MPECEEVVRSEMSWGFAREASWQQPTPRVKATWEEAAETQKVWACRNTGMGRGWIFEFMQHPGVEMAESGVGSGPQ